MPLSGSSKAIHRESSEMGALGLPTVLGPIMEGGWGLWLTQQARLRPGRQEVAKQRGWWVRWMSPGPCSFLEFPVSGRSSWDWPGPA